MPGKRYAVGYASGVFDMFHIGHLNLLQRSRPYCSRLVVGVASDEYVERLKGRSPVVPLSERLRIVQALRVVDEVVVDHSEDKREAHAARTFDVIFKGDDWRNSPRGQRLEREMAAVGADVMYFPYTAHTSSTMLRTFLTENVG